MKNYLYIILFFSSLGSIAQTIPNDKNAVIQSKFRVATTLETDASNPSKALINISYADGLGRGLQTVGYQQSPTNKDLVSGAVEFDKFGRIIRTALPTPTSNNTGTFQSDAFGLANGFYGDSYAYTATTTFDNSPLNRAREQYGAGNTWRTNIKRIQSFDEAAGTDIRYYYINSSGDIILSGTYSANSLYKKRIIDEQGQTSIEITDKRGRLIQRQTQDNLGYITTYYLYDGLGRVLAVIQPEGYELNTSIIKNSTDWKKWVFSYEYDYRGRVHLKYVSASGDEYFVYDKWDRLVWSQTALQREVGKWTFYKYDVFNREVIRGEKLESRGLVALETETWAWAGSRFESQTSSGIFYSFSNSYPQLASDVDIRHIIYYDNYNYWVPTGMAFADGGTAFHTQYSEVRGLLAGTRSRNSINNSWLASVAYYDNKGRVIRSFTQNVYGQIEQLDTQFNHANEVLQTKKIHKNSSGTATTEITQNDLDNAGRVKKVYHGINVTPSEVASMTYDEIGRLTQKKIRVGTYTIGVGKLLKAKVFLMGALTSGGTLMIDNIRQQGLIPLTEPYTVLGGRFVHTGGGGGEQTTTQVLNSNVGTVNAIVDWVFLELRDATNSSLIRKTRAALLQRDGDIVDVDGVSDVNFGVLAASSYYVVIKHRNHMGVMTSSAISFINSTTIVDFSTLTASQIYNNAGYDGVEMRFAVSPFRLWMGDTNRDSQVKYSGTGNDMTPIGTYVYYYPTNTAHDTEFNSAFGYESADVNMDGKVKLAGVGNDVSEILNSLLAYPLNTAQSSTYVIPEQLPITSQAAGEAPSNIPALQTIDYSYHLRGGLRGINLDAAGNPTPKANDGDLFSYKLDYETAGFYDGNIGKQTWQTANNNSPTGLRSYTFSYDVAKRLTNATYTGINSESYGLYILQYDKNGNIGRKDPNAFALQRYGKTGSTYGLIDNLKYVYDGNRLSQVTDGIATNNNVDLVPRGGGLYSYYTDGSLKSDANEQISLIIYDTYLKQPKEIQLVDGRRIYHYYDGAGALLKTVYSTGEYWEYGGIIYKNGLPYQMSTPEGRAIYTAGAWQYEYFYTDHLGNTRVAFKATGSQLIKNSETAFDPLGVVLNGVGQVNTTQNRFEYQDKEKESTFGLNRINLGARTYNPTTGRMDGVDALADVMRRHSPYQANFNNPLRFLDPDGNESQDFTYTDGYGTYSARNSSGSVGFSGSYQDAFGDEKPKPKTPQTKATSTPEPNATEEKSKVSQVLPAAAVLSQVDGPVIPVGDIVAAGVIIAAAVEDLKNRVYVTYTLKNPLSGKIYVGRTSGFGDAETLVRNRYNGHHMKVLGYADPQVESVGIGPQGYYAIRGREQGLIDAYGGIGDSKLGNSINGISPFNPLGYTLYKPTALATFGPVIQSTLRK